MQRGATDSPRTVRAFNQEAAGREELIKCVVVGDCGVGKTKLVCARACRTLYTLSELVTQARTPTIWAIDHYAQDEEIVEQARCTVDGSVVHLRLWDTFGYHDKDRRFAYDGADVVFLCFSLVRPRSLENIRTMWYPEACRLCSSVPMIVVGCQADLRYLHLNKSFQAMDKSYFFGEIASKDVIHPEMGRAVATSLGLPYYETSVLTGFGVGCAFDNAIRAALLHRGQGLLGQHFKHVQPPLPQLPECPQQPETPLVLSPRSAVSSNLSAWLQHSGGQPASTLLPASSSSLPAISDDGKLSDVVFACLGGSVLYHCHMIVVCAGSPVLKELLGAAAAAAADSTTQAAAAAAASRADLVCSKQRSATGDAARLQLLLRVTAVSSLPAQQAHGSTTVAVDGSVDAGTIASLLYFLYTGQLDPASPVAPAGCGGCDVHCLRKLAELLRVPELAAACADALDCADVEWPAAVKQVSQRFVDRRATGFRELGIREQLFTDVVFRLEDGCLPAHRVLLAAHCDVMNAMFCSSFRDSSARCIPVHDFGVATCAALLDTLYTGRCVVDMKPSGYVDLIALANQLCLPNVVACAEEACVRKLAGMHSLGHDTVAVVLDILEAAELHNAPQLACWCRHHLAVNYVMCFNRHRDSLLELSSSNQETIAQSRWPPLWYLRELDYYEKRVRALRMAAAALDLRTVGCLCFNSRGRKQQQQQQDKGTGSSTEQLPAATFG